jgi:hypothetical protein
MGTQAFTASVINTPNTAVTWQVNKVTGGNATLGTISASGVYTPPATVSAQLIVTVTATSDAVNTQTASAQVTVTAPPSSSGGGGAIDFFTLAAGLFVITRRSKVLPLAVRHSLGGLEPFSLSATVVRRGNARLL